MYKSIINKLDELNINFDEFEHKESKSCNDSKNFRDEAGFEGIGSKNIVFHAKGKFYLVTTIGDKNLKARKFKKEFGTKDIRFANVDEIKNTINGVIGCIPPFGFNNNDIQLFIDKEIFKYDYFMFNPGISTKTIRIKTIDLKDIYKNLKNIVKEFDFNGDEVLFKEI